MKNNLQSKPQKETRVTNEHMKRCLTSLVIREVQIKTTARNQIIKNKPDRRWRGAGPRAPRGWFCLTGTVSVLRGEGVLEMVQVTLLNCASRNDYDNKFYVYFATQKFFFN